MNEEQLNNFSGCDIKDLFDDHFCSGFFDHRFNQIDFSNSDSVIVMKHIDILSKKAYNFIYNHYLLLFIIKCLKNDNLDFVYKNKNLMNYDELKKIFLEIYENIFLNHNFNKIFLNLSKVLSAEEMIKFSYLFKDLIFIEYYDDLFNKFNCEIEKKVFQETSCSKKLPEELNQCIINYLG